MSDGVQSATATVKNKMEPIVEENELCTKREALELFEMCDHGQKGFVTIGDLTQLKLDLGLTTEQMEAVFCQLDKDGDGLLTPEEFEAGLELFLGPHNVEMADKGDGLGATLSNDSTDNWESKRQLFRKGLGSTKCFTNSIDLEQVLPSNMEVSELLQDQGAIQLWYQMQSEHPDMLPTFENFLKNLASGHRRIQDEISTLHQSFNKKSVAYEKQIRVLYEEMENQIQEEREKIHSKKSELEKQLRNELEDAVQTKDEDIQELMDRWTKATQELEIATEDKAATENANSRLLQEKEQLEQQLEEYQTQLDGLRSQMNSSKDSDLPEKRERFRCALKLSERIAWEREALLKQLDLLRSINRRLQDERDEVASGRLYQMESTDDVFSLSTEMNGDLTNNNVSHSEENRRGSILADYFGEQQPRSQFESESSDLGDFSNQDTLKNQEDPRKKEELSHQETLDNNKDIDTKDDPNNNDTLDDDKKDTIDNSSTKLEVEGNQHDISDEVIFPPTNPFAPENMSPADFTTSEIDPFFGSANGNNFTASDLDPFFGNVKKNDFDSISYVNFSDPEIAIDATIYFSDPPDSPFYTPPTTTTATPVSTVTNPVNVDTRMPTLCLVHPNNHQTSNGESYQIFCPDLESLCRSKVSAENENSAPVVGSQLPSDNNNALTTLKGDSTNNVASVRLTQQSPDTITDPMNLPQTVFKVIFIGDSGVGKTSLINRICGGQFSDRFCTTIGVDFRVRTVVVNGLQVVLQLWDTAGQERFRSLTGQYMRRSDGVVIVYDVNSETTFRNVGSWLSSIESVSDENLSITLVGNKADLGAANTRKAVSTQHGQRLAKGQSALFFETSARDGLGVEELITSVARRLQTKQVEDIQNCVTLTANMASSTKSSSSSCC